MLNVFYTFTVPNWIAEFNRRSEVKDVYRPISVVTHIESVHGMVVKDLQMDSYYTFSVNLSFTSFTTIYGYEKNSVKGNSEMFQRGSIGQKRNRFTTSIGKCSSVGTSFNLSGSSIPSSCYGRTVSQSL